MPLNTTVTTTPTQDAKSQGVGELSSLESGGYDFTTTRYPLSVGTNDAPHYVIFNINLPDNSAYLANNTVIANVNSASQTNYDLKQGQGGIYQLNGTSVSQAAAGGFLVGLVNPAPVGGALGTAAGATLINTVGSQLQIRPKLKRIAKAIALYMPDTVLFEYQHDWQTSSVTEALGVGGQAAVVGGGLGNVLGNEWDNLKGLDFKKMGTNIYNNAQGAEAVGYAASALGGGSNFGELALRSINKAINPQVEMVFKGTDNRGFVFTFDFQPRSSAESADILDIIRTFRLYAAPELTKDGGGRYYIPPGQFDISFYFNNLENQKIPRISTCALVGIAVNYVGSGQYATFNDGMPVHINLQLTFKEMDIIYRELIDKQGY